MVILLSVAIALSIHIKLRIAKNAEGICIAENRVLSSEEHRQAFLRNLVQLSINNSNIHDGIHRTEALRTGIIRDTRQLDLRALVKAYYNNGKSFEENFSIEMVAPREHGFDITQLDEPFVLVNYHANRIDISTFTPSSSVIKADARQEIKEKYSPSLYEKYRGFGNNYYKIKYTFIGRGCCDNRLFHRSQKEYLEEKRRSYNETISSFDLGFATHTDIAIASNCGAILTYVTDNGISTRAIRRIFGVGE
ncbi:MAG: hypothetical protein P8166_11140 [Candidatus Thiodiazotropha sp.]